MLVERNQRLVEQLVRLEDMAVVERNQNLVERPVRSEDMLLVEKDQIVGGQPVHSEDMMILGSHNTDLPIPKHPFQSCLVHMARHLVVSGIVRNRHWGSGWRDHKILTASAIGVILNWNCRIERYMTQRSCGTGLEGQAKLDIVRDKEV